MKLTVIPFQSTEFVTLSPHSGPDDSYHERHDGKIDEGGEKRLRRSGGLGVRNGCRSSWRKWGDLGAVLLRLGQLEALREDGTEQHIDEQSKRERRFGGLVERGTFGAKLRYLGNLHRRISWDGRE